MIKIPSIDLIAPPLKAWQDTNEDESILRALLPGLVPRELIAPPFPSILLRTIS
jgi:hypothetical protein